MKLKFYSKFIVLLLSVIPQCFSATVHESESVARGRAFITEHDTARCEKYNQDPATKASFRGHTSAIDTLLGDKSKVKQNEIASDKMIRTIITAVIDKEITHCNDASKPESQVEQTLSALNPADPLYGHFTVLSLFEKAAAAFVTGPTTNIFNSSDIGAIVSQADSIIAEITKLNARITKTVFTDCLTITYGKHNEGITAVVTAEKEALRITAAVKEQERLQKLKEAEEEARRVAALKVEQEEAERVAALKAEQEEARRIAALKAEQEEAQRVAALLAEQQINTTSGDEAEEEEAGDETKTTSDNTGKKKKKKKKTKKK